MATATATANPINMTQTPTVANPLSMQYPQQSPVPSSATQGYDPQPNTMPTMPGWVDPYNSSMEELPQMEQLLSGTSYNTQPLQQDASYAQDPNASPWAQQATAQSYQQQQQAMSQEAGNQAGAEATQDNNLAMSGGLSSGARERVAEQGQQGLISGDQGIYTQGLNNRTQIGINDAQNKLQMMQALPGMETQAYQAELEPIQMEGQAMSADVANQMAATNSLNQYQLGMGQTEMSGYGAEQNALAVLAAQQDADAHSGIFGNGGILGTGLGASAPSNPVTTNSNGSFSMGGSSPSSNYVNIPAGQGGSGTAPTGTPGLSTGASMYQVRPGGAPTNAGGAPTTPAQTNPWSGLTNPASDSGFFNSLVGSNFNPFAPNPNKNPGGFLGQI